MGGYAATAGRRSLDGGGSNYFRHAIARRSLRSELGEPSRGEAAARSGFTEPQFCGKPKVDNLEKKNPGIIRFRDFATLAVWTGLEPATPCVTGRYSNQLNYHTVFL